MQVLSAVISFKGLNDRGRDDILVVDNLTNMVKFKNIQGLKVMDYMDKVDFSEP